jgi:metabotropic X receptor
MLLLGTFLSFTTTFAIVAKPSPENCGIMRFGIGFCYTVCYAAVVTKANRVSRIFATQRNPRFTSPVACITIACGLVMVEVVINVIWIIVEPPVTTQAGRD